MSLGKCVYLQRNIFELCVYFVIISFKLCEMKRILLDDLIKWKAGKDRLPLIIKGARQVGKTWLLKEFGRTCFKDTCYINFEQTMALNDIFSGEIQPRRIIDLLTAFHGRKILPHDTLIIFDEIQENPRALSSLKAFAELAPEYTICCAGSLLGVALHNNTSFPVGKVEFLTLEPLSFEEFLIANDEQMKVDFVKAHNLESIPEYIHEKLEDYLKLFFIIGGMPASVMTWLETRDFSKVDKKQTEILYTYEQDFSKHAPKSIIPRIRHLWKSIPSQLAKENKKFLYGLIKDGARAREYEEALLWLFDSGLIRSVSRITKPGLPLKSYEDLKSFKIYHLDVGLLRAMSELSPDVIIDKIRIYEEFKGALTEQYVLQEIAVLQNIKNVYYWKSEATAEIDFIIAYKNNIIPIEVKSGKNLQSKSLKVYIEKFQPQLSIKTSILNLEYQDKLLNIPLYALFNMTQFIEMSSLGS